MKYKKDKTIGQTNVLTNGRKTIGVLLGTMTSKFHYEILRGVHDGAIEKDYNVLSFIGGPLSSPTRLAKLRDRVFELIDTDMLDGVIVPFGSHTRYLNIDETKAFVDSLSAVPIINIEGNIEGITNINSDFEYGLSEVITHFIEVHNYKKIAFFRGPRNHPASEERMKIYKDNLVKHGIEINEDLIVYGVLQRVEAEYFIEELFDKRNKKCDAIITVNDNMAIGVIDCLKERGISVPEDVAVCGMMGGSEGLFSRPALTTIKQPVYEAGKQAVLSLATQIDGTDGPTNIKIPTKFIIRESCGCEVKHTVSPLKDNDHKIINGQVDKDGYREYLDHYIKQECLDVLDKMLYPRGEEWVEKILDRYYEAILKGKQNEFFGFVNELLDREIFEGNSMPWLGILTILKLDLIKLINQTKEPKELLAFLNQFVYLQDQIGVKDASFKGYEIDFYLNSFREVTSSLNSSFDLEAIKNNLINLLDLTECYISSFEEVNNSNSLANNLIAIRNKKLVKLEDNDKQFKASLLIPQSINSYEERYSLMVFPLSFREDFMGFAVLNLSNRRGTAYENTQAIISAALKNELQITKQKRQEKRIRKLAYYDGLTGLLNRVRFEAILEELMNEVEMNSKGFAIMFLDIDRFKNINDSMGHAYGDMLLKRVAELLKDCLREQDIIARFGGDEFTIIITNTTDEEVAAKVANKILKRLSEMPIYIQDNQLFITASIGIAMVPRDGATTISILKNADTAMYIAKGSGRNQYALYSREIEESHEDRLKYEEILHNALNEQEFMLEYQPQVQCGTGKIVGVEALVRIRSKKYGMIPPNKFIPLAEELGLIGKIDEWAFETACNQLSIWNKKGYEDITMSVNISTYQLRHQQLVSEYMKIVDRYDIKANDLRLEMTENSLIENEDIAREILKAFEANGIDIAVDDFGTGYSSLYCIQMYPIRAIKIDRAFVKDLVYNSKNMAIIKAIIQMSKDLDFIIVAEGVETVEQYKMVKNLGCDLVQGYYFSKPKSAGDIEMMLEEGCVEYVS